jgi:hypothetical protein
MRARVAWIGRWLACLLLPVFLLTASHAPVTGHGADMAPAAMAGMDSMAVCPDCEAQGAACAAVCMACHVLASDAAIQAMGLAACSIMRPDRAVGLVRHPAEVPIPPPRAA